MKVTTTWLDSRAAPKGRPSARTDVNVDGREGLIVRLHPTGAISFRIRYQRQGKRHWMVLGEYGKDGLSLADAFDQHNQAQRELERGLDPIEERAKRQDADKRAREERDGSDTIAKLVEQFVHRKLRGERWDKDDARWVRDEKTKTKARKRPEAAAALLGHFPAGTKHRDRGMVTFVSEFGKLKARDLSKRQIVRFLEEIADRPAPVTANRVYSLLKQMFAWAVGQDHVPASPMAGMDRPGGEESPRERVLTAEEIKKLWTALDSEDVEMAAPTRLALKLLLITGQRRGELTFAKWSHFDIGAGLWTIPVELLKSSHARRSKAEPHFVPLSALAIEHLDRLRAISGNGSYLFPGRADKKSDRSYSERVLSRAVRENAKEFGIPHFTPHDLRRTTASFMTKIGVPRLHVEKVLNHSTGDIAEVYDRHDYLPEKRVALTKWATHLQTLISGQPHEDEPHD